MGGTVSLLCTALEPCRSLDIHVVYTPASGKLWGRECKLAPSFIEEFLEKPRCPEPNEYEPFPPATHFIDLALASGNMPKENSQLLPNGGRRAAANPQTPPNKLGRSWTRSSCGMRCGTGRMGQGSRCTTAFGSDPTPIQDAEQADHALPRKVASGTTP